jgi:hypothetical protein
VFAGHSAGGVIATIYAARASVGRGGRR